MAVPYSDLTLNVALDMMEPSADDDVTNLMRTLASRVASARSEMQNFREWCARADDLYYAEKYTRGGADLWPDDPSATTQGASHVSVNTPPLYVDVPASLQAYEPIENMLATDVTVEAREAAAGLERVRAQWKIDEEYDLKWHKACVTKALYGRTAAKVYWDANLKRPCVEIIEQPQNLWLGYRSDSYAKPEWAAYVQKLSPNAVAEEFGVDVTVRDYEGTSVPFVSPDPFINFSVRPWLDLNFGGALVEVWDYWYRQFEKGKMVTYNAVFAGAVAIRGPVAYPEYKGAIPYLPLFNTFLPGIPNGRPELRDVEPLIRETYERITSGSQMIASATAGDFWQLTGPESSPRQAQGLKPARNTVISPGPGNRIETITPFIAQFQLEQYLGRIDRSKAEVSGLNDLLLGLAPAQVLSSSKAINALISNYESRLAMRRLLLYTWRRATWAMTVSIWAVKDKTIRALVANGGGTLDIIDPSLSPRDEMETATKARNLVDGKLWSQIRGMDAVGVDDPETEQDIIRRERTDASLFPADVQIMAQLMAALQSLGVQTPGNAQDIAQQQLASGQNDLRTALGAARTQGTNATQGAESQGQLPPEAGTPGPGGAPPGAPFAQGPSAPSVGVAQTMIQGGQGKSRILTQQQLGRR